MSEAPGGPPVRVRVGDLLVASPTLLDPNFTRTVVLMLDVDDEGALGVVLNRPSTVPVGEVLPAWRDLTGPLGVLFSGGPVSTESALAVGASSVLTPEVVSAAEDDPIGFRRLFDDVGIVDLDSPTAVVGPGLRGLRVFAGYAGWGREQLADEIDSGAWYVLPSQRGDVFGDDPAGLWTRVLRRQPGELAWVTTRPADPTQN